MAFISLRSMVFSCLETKCGVKFIKRASFIAISLMVTDVRGTGRLCHDGSLSEAVSAETGLRKIGRNAMLV